MPTALAIMREVRGSSLPPTDRHILMTLISLADPESGIIPERFQPSFSDLARFTGLGRSTVARRLPFLEEAGWIKRTAPSLAAAWKDKEKNSYLLLIPTRASQVDPAEEPAKPARTSPRAGLVPEGDQSTDQSQSGTSPTAGPVLVPEGDRTSPRAGLEVPNPRTFTNQPPPTEEGARLDVDHADGLFPSTGQMATIIRPKRASTKAAKPAGEGNTNAGVLVGELVDICKANEIKLPKNIVGRYAASIKDHLEQQFSADLIRRVLSDMVAEGVINKPSWLPERIVAAQSKRPGWTDRNKKPSPSRHRVTDSHADVDAYKENF